jgi:hypothetical protein
MMQTLNQLLLAKSISHLVSTMILTGGFLLYWFDVAKLHKVLYFKPFNCQPCLSFWVALLVYFMPTNYQLPLIGATTTIFLYIILKDKYNGN